MYAGVLENVLYGIGTGVKSGMMSTLMMSLAGHPAMPGPAVGICCRYQRPWPASTRFVKAAGANAKKIINSLVFIILNVRLVIIFFCKYTHFFYWAKEISCAMKKQCPLSPKGSVFACRQMVDYQYWRGGRFCLDSASLGQGSGRGGREAGMGYFFTTRRVAPAARRR